MPAVDKRIDVFPITRRGEVCIDWIGHPQPVPPDGSRSTAVNPRRDPMAAHLRAARPALGSAASAARSMSFSKRSILSLSFSVESFSR